MQHHEVHIQGTLGNTGASGAFDRNQQTPHEFLEGHLSGDWGELCNEDRQLNEEALVDGARLMSAYRLKDNTRIWCITESKSDGRERTTRGDNFSLAG